ncbi:5'-nucleotidase, lipoprotein e(P4) family [Mucilaginibacter paludis]|uniref:5'-nucleotidase, lipoprotein e(P4) family n=1 Tax=Mucilaginibacter paludis DSM 18603 TaxID=714943 RepID=H1Y097_9SPHI|nr:5'-nucleotidase, lipoprotein e(P4) family [Mucilaginibacter paludis]EHQ28146.1 5'-nucleotidase, lipoprotein e(P4) family [Mucilaginibacter paludis DSM 18603]
MFKKTIVIASAAFLTLTSIAKAQQTPSTANFIADGKLWSSLWQQKAAEYRALCFQAYNIAQLRADQSLLKTYGKPLAIVTDIDETLLDNSPNSVHQGLLGKDYETKAWLNWTSKSIADTVPGAPSFLKYAASKGITVYYITNREESERAATLKNLQLYGFPNADNEHLMMRQTTSSKELRRQEVAKTHEIILLLGDNLADFSSLFDKKTVDERLKNTQEQAALFGKLFIIIPNANYGDWETSLYEYNYKLTPAQKEEIFKKNLKTE